MLDEIIASDHRLNVHEASEFSSSYWSEAEAVCQSEGWKDSPALVIYTSGTTGMPKVNLASNSNFY